MLPLTLRFGRKSALTLVVAGFVINKWTLERTLVSDGTITSPLTLVGIGGAQLALIGCGFLLLRRGSVSLAVPVAALAISLLVALAAAEAVPRLFPEFRPVARAYVGQYPNEPSRHFLPDSATGWRMRPRYTFQWLFGGQLTTYVSNSHGVRESSEFAEGGSGRGSKPRVVFIGDSFVFGTGVEQDHTVDAQLEDSLGHRVEAPNLGMPGFGLDQMWMSLRHQALPLSPSLLVVAFIDEDWDRSLTAFRTGEKMNKPTFIREGDSLRRRTPADRPGPLARIVENHSALWRLLQLSRRTAAFRWPTGEWWTLNSALVQAMARDAADRGVPILFVRLPRKNLWRPFPALQAHMDRIGAQYIDLADPSRMRSDVHLETDDHINERGHAWLAGEILNSMRAHRPPGLVAALR